MLAWLGCPLRLLISNEAQTVPRPLMNFKLVCAPCVLPTSAHWHVLLQFRVHVALLTASGLVSMDDCKLMEQWTDDSGWKDADPEHGSVYWAAGAEMIESYVSELTQIIAYVGSQAHHCSWQLWLSSSSLGQSMHLPS